MNFKCSTTNLHHMFLHVGRGDQNMLQNYNKWLLCQDNLHGRTREQWSGYPCKLLEMKTFGWICFGLIYYVCMYVCFVYVRVQQKVSCNNLWYTTSSCLYTHINNKNLSKSTIINFISRDIHLEGLTDH